MDRLWSLLFLAVPIMGVAIVMGAAMDVGITNRWLPESIGPRTAGIDHLFEMIHVILGITFLFTGLILAFCLWRFRAGSRSTAMFVHKNTLLELVWTVVPAGILIFLALYQLPYWQQNKEQHPALISGLVLDQDDYLPPIARVVARQYGWKFIYPGRDGEFDTRDDIISENVMVLPANEELVLELVSEDVIHSFCITQLRLKQDIVPGLQPHVWFRISGEGEWEIHCMELCGWGHYRMNARLIVLQRPQYDLWKAFQSQFSDQNRQQRRRQIDPRTRGRFD